jgi:hypothetical protein
MQQVMSDPIKFTVVLLFAIKYYVQCDRLAVLIC